MRKTVFISILLWLSAIEGSAYEKHNALYVIDQNNHLYWQDDFSSQKSSEDWKDAVTFCDQLNLDGMTHWRLPTFKELFSITDYSRVPTIDPAFTFMNEGSYWTSTPFAPNKSRAWTIDFKTGETYYSYKTTNHAVRCVKEMPIPQKETK